MVPNKASQQRAYCLPLSHVCQGFIWTITGLAFIAHPTSPWAQTSGFILERLIYSVWGSLSLVINIIILCPLFKGMLVCSLSPNMWIVTPNLCRLNHHSPFPTVPQKFPRFSHQGSYSPSTGALLMGGKLQIHS